MTGRTRSNRHLLPLVVLVFWTGNHYIVLLQYGALSNRTRSLSIRTVRLRPGPDVVEFLSHLPS